MEHFFSPNSSGDLRSDAHQSQIIGGDAEVDHTQIIGGIQSNYCGGYIPPSFGTPGCNNGIDCANARDDWTTNFRQKGDGQLAPSSSGGFRGGMGGCIPPTSQNITCICIILNIKKKAISEYSIGRVTAI